MKKLDFNTFIELGSKYNINVEVNADLSEEYVSNFNDMGLLQAKDNITAVLSVMNILYDNSLTFNSKKVIIYGHSHGAYLSYLCNAFAPKLFSLIIDNSAWLYPVYLNNCNRFVTSKIGNLTLVAKFDYLAKRIITDTEILNLPYLYSKFKNKCNIVSYHGINDNLIDCKDKASFCNNIGNCSYNEISQGRVDNVMFKSTNHGLDSDFIEVFNFTMNKFNVKFEKDTYLNLQNEVAFTTNNHKYVIDYENIIPKLKVL